MYEAETSRLERCSVALGDARIEDPQSWDLLLFHEMCATEGILHKIEGAAPVMACCHGTKYRAEHCCAANWKSLLERLRNLFQGSGLVFFGSGEERGMSERLEADWRDADHCELADASLDCFVSLDLIEAILRLIVR